MKTLIKDWVLMNRSIQEEKDPSIEKLMIDTYNTCYKVINEKLDDSFTLGELLLILEDVDIEYHYWDYLANRPIAKNSIPLLSPVKHLKLFEELIIFI